MIFCGEVELSLLERIKRQCDSSTQTEGENKTKSQEVVSKGSRKKAVFKGEYSTIRDTILLGFYISFILLICFHTAFQQVDFDLDNSEEEGYFRRVIFHRKLEIE